MPRKLPSSKSDLLKQTDIFSLLLTHEIKIIANNSEYRVFTKGEPVFSEGDPGSALYIVQSGEVVVRREEEFEEGVDIARLIPGSCFGELDLFTETPREANALAMKETKLLIFPKAGTGFREILNTHPDLSARILHKILVNFAGRIRSANALIKENSPLMQELKKQVYRDKLTGIYNQVFLMEKIRKMVKGENRFALLIVKPDNFKDLNDTYGHEAGDSAIRIIARRLRDFIGDDNRVVRYKGNAMAVILNNPSRKEAYSLGVSIRDFIHHLDVSSVCGGKDFPLTGSVGISLFPENGTSPEALASQTHELPLEGRRRGGDLVLFPEDLRDKP